MHRHNEVTVTQSFGPLLRPGQILHEKYSIQKILGRGGMGIAVGAHHLHLARPVALKLLLPELAVHPHHVDRFLQEARIASRIISPHIPQIFDMDIMPPNIPYIVMEWLNGQDLMSLWREKKSLDIAFTVQCVIEACKALEIAHQLGIIHRDIKPANLFLARTEDGAERIKVLDFGISKQLRANPSGEATRTLPGTMLGTVDYMAPEQIRSADSVNARADIWSLGVTLYRLLTGKAPFRGSNPTDTAALILNVRPPHPSTLRPDIPTELGTLILKCLEKDPERRFLGAGELMAALEPFAERTELWPHETHSFSHERTRVVPTPKRPSSAPSFTLTCPPSKRPLRIFSFAFLAGALLCSGTAFFILLRHRSTPLPRAARSPYAQLSTERRVENSAPPSSLEAPIAPPQPSATGKHTSTPSNAPRVAPPVRPLNHPSPSKTTQPSATARSPPLERIPIPEPSAESSHPEF